MVLLRSGTMIGTDLCELRLFDDLPGVQDCLVHRRFYSMRVWQCHVSDPTRGSAWAPFLSWVDCTHDVIAGEGVSYDAAADDAVLKLRECLEYSFRGGCGPHEVFHGKNIVPDGLSHIEASLRKEPGLSLSEATEYCIFIDIHFGQGMVKQMGWGLDNRKWHIWRAASLTSLDEKCRYVAGSKLNRALKHECGSGNKGD